MRILIFEDEHYSAERLISLIIEQMPDAQILDVIDSVEDGEKWLASHIEPNLIFMDIQLADGLSFQMLKKVQVNCPIIFVTAFDNYALQAFKVNSIDYLLKPIDKDALINALKKYQNYFPSQVLNTTNYDKLSIDLTRPTNKFKQRYLIKSGGGFGYLSIKDICLIYSEDGLSFCYDKEGRRYHLDNSLDIIHGEIDPNDFYRVSRKHIVSLNFISKIHPYFNNRLKVEMKIDCKSDVIVSRERVKSFKNWIDS